MWSGAPALHSDGVPLPLLGVVVQVTMLEFIAHVVIEQKYRNPHPKPIEAIYTFPLDSQSVLRSFNVEMDGRKLYSQIEEKEQAKISYEEALDSGQGSALLVQDPSMRDVFTLRLGNLPPNASATVTLDYVTQVDEEPQEDGSVKLRFVLPAAVAPRYTPHHYHRHDLSQAFMPGATGPPVEPGSADGGDAAIDASEWPSPQDLLTMTGNVTSGSKILAIDALTHGAQANTSATGGWFRVVSPALDQDVVVAVHLQDRCQDRAWVDESGAVMVSTGLEGQVETGRQEEAQEPGEFVFVIDRSGSMWGESIQQARQTLSLCISSLPVGAVFNIIGFGSTFTSLFPEPRLYDDETKRLALEHCQGIEADMGGTEILEPLLSLAKTKGRKTAGGRRVILLTDGQVSNTDEVVALVRRDHGRSGTRYLSIGIGAGVSRDLVLRVAAAGEGTAEFVVEGERMHGKAMRQMRRALEPGLSSVRVDYGALKLRGQPSPRAARPLYTGTRQLSYALLADLSNGTDVLAGQRNVTVHATRPDGTPVSWAVPLARSPFRGIIRPMAAHSVLQELVDDEEDEALGNQTRAKLREEAIALSLVTGVPCKWTSFVAVDQASDPLVPPEAGRPLPVRIPLGVLQPPQFGGMHATPMAFSTMASATMAAAGGAMPRMALARAAPGGGGAMDKAAAFNAGPGLAYFSAPQSAQGLAAVADVGFEAEAMSDTAAPPAMEDDHVSILAWQLASGAWVLDDALIKAAGGAKEADAVRAEGADAADPKVWATSLALAMLEVRWQGFEEEWGAGAEKGRRWLDRQVGGSEEAGRWIDRARRLVQRLLVSGSTPAETAAAA